MPGFGTFGGLVVRKLASGTFGGLVVSMQGFGTFGGLVISMLASGTFGGLTVSMLASGTFGGLVVSMLGFGFFGGLVVSMLASGTQFQMFKPGRRRRINLSMSSFGEEVKRFVLSQICGMLKNTTITVEVNIIGNMVGQFSLIFPPVANRGLSRRLMWSAYEV
jgi:hypothetical protein